jgi:hypothetical protein
MNLAKCKFINAKSTKQLGTPQVAKVYVVAVTFFSLRAHDIHHPTRSCGADPIDHTVSDPSKCTKGAKQPFYWLQAEGNNYFDSLRPGYRPEFGFTPGAQNDIFRGENEPSGPPAYPPTVTTLPNWWPPRPTLTTCPPTTGTQSTSTQSTTSTPSVPHTPSTQSTTSTPSMPPPDGTGTQSTTSSPSMPPADGTGTQSTTSTPSMPPADETSTPTTHTTSTATHRHHRHHHHHHHHHHRPWDRRRMTAERDV